MAGHRSAGLKTILLTTLIGLVASTACFLAAAPQRKPVREEVVFQDVPLVVDYTPTVTSRDVMLPFHRGARLETGYRYQVTSKEGKPVAFYAVAVLTSSDAPEAVSQAYSALLPGRPAPEVVGEKEGRRWVLAVASEEEVRRITITAAGEGSQIELVRASGVTLPPRPLQPKGAGERVT